MASLYDLKPAFQRILRPFCGRLAARGVTANAVTITACGASILYGLWLWLGNLPWLALILLPVFQIVRMGLNAIDGMLAREFGQKSRLGGLLNELTDVLADTALYLPFMLVPGLAPLPVALLVLLGVISEMTGVISVQIGGQRRYDGPFGKSDRAVFFGLFAVALATDLLNGGIVSLALIWLAILAAIATIANRARSALRETRDSTA